MPFSSRFRRVRYLFDSLLGEVLLWILTLLFCVWGFSVLLTYQVADRIADQPYDEQLANKVRALAMQIHAARGKAVLTLPPVARDVLLADAKDHLRYAVSAGNAVIAGDHDIPWVEAPRVLDPGTIGYYDTEMNGDDVRVAFLEMSLPELAEPVLIQVAETRKKRTDLAAHMVGGIIVPQFVLVPIAVLLVYLGFTHGITPMQRLQSELRERSPVDLSPIDEQGIPEEVRPVIQALNDVMARLEHSLDSQRRFIADAAHQLKTPLTGLRTQTELALRESNPQAVREGLQRIATGAENLSHLTRQLLSLARAEAGTGQGNVLDTLDLDALARAATMEWADRALAKGIDVGFESAGLPLKVSGNALLLHEALTNLIDNAVKYTPPGGHVTIRGRRDGDERVCVEVEDSGPGIPPAERERVFERFYRVLGSGVDGSGLGLAIVRQTAELFGGTVTIGEAPNGPGSLFTLAFPKA